MFEETGVVTQLKPVSFKFEIDNIKDKEFYSKCPGLVLRTPSKNSNCMCGNDLSKNALGNECKPSITNKKLDEKPLTVCIDGEFRCQNAEKCIKNILLCDGVFDCRGKNELH